MRPKVYILSVAILLLIAGAMVLYFAFARETTLVPTGAGYTELKLTGDFDRKWEFKAPISQLSGMTAAGGSLLVSLQGVSSLNAETGEQLWSTQKAPRSEIAVAEGILAYTDKEGVLEVLDAASGEEKWSRRVVGANGIDSVIVAKGIIYVSIQEVAVSAFDTSGKELWSTGVGANITGIGAIGNTVYVAGTLASQGNRGPDSAVVALDSSTGRQKWRFQGGGRDIGVASGNGALFVSSGSGLSSGSYLLTSLDAETGATRWQNTDQSLTLPMFFNDRLYVRSTDSGGAAVLMAIEPQTGNKVWECHLPESDRVERPAAVAGGLVFFVGHSTLNAADLDTGELKWRARFGGPVKLGPVVAGDSLCFTYGDGATIYALPLPKVAPAPGD